MSQPRFVHVQYCDDIRQEINGKYSLMGCYGTDMVIDPLPAVIPKLCAQVKVETPRERPFEKLTIRAHLNDGDPFYEIEHPRDALKLGQERIEFDEDSLGIIVLTFMLTFSPFYIPEQGKITIEVETEDGVVKGNPLKIRKRDDSTAQFVGDGA